MKIVVKITLESATIETEPEADLKTLFEKDSDYIKMFCILFGFKIKSKSFARSNQMVISAYKLGNFPMVQTFRIEKHMLFSNIAINSGALSAFCTFNGFRVTEQSIEPFENDGQ